MAKQTPLTLERIVRDARRQHGQSQYPGDLAADLGLDTNAARPARRLWLMRWVPAFAAAAVLLIGAAVLWQTLAASNAADPQKPAHVAEVDEADEPTEVEPAPQRPADDTAVDRSPAALARAIPPAALEDAADKFSATSARATQAAAQQLSQQWIGRKAPPAPTVPAFRVHRPLGSMPTLTATDLNLPRGLRLSVPSLSTLRKELS